MAAVFNPETVRIEGEVASENLRCRPGGRGSAFRLALDCVLQHFPAMQSHELLREVFKDSSPKLIAAELGVSLSMVYKWAETQDGEGSGATNPLDRIHAMIRITNDHRIVQWLCEKAGGFFIQNPKSKHPHPEFLIPATNSIVQEFADLLSVIAIAAADNHISKQEARDIRRRWEDLKSVTECFVKCCEDGNFSRLRENPPALAAEVN